MESQDPTLVYANAEQTVITSRKIMSGEAKMPYEIFVIKRPSNAYYKMTRVNAMKQIGTIDSNAINKQNLEITKETKKILGYTCYRAKTSVTRIALISGIRPS